MSTSQNIQLAFFFFITICTSVQGNPLLVVASKSIAVEVITPKPKPSIESQTWKQKRIQKKIDRKIKKIKSTSSKKKGSPLANITLGLGLAQLVFAKIFLVNILGVSALGLLATASFWLMPVIGILTLIFGILAHFQIKKNPEKFSGKKKAKLGLWLGLGLFIAVFGSFIGWLICCLPV